MRRHPPAVGGECQWSIQLPTCQHRGSSGISSLRAIRIRPIKWPADVFVYHCCAFQSHEPSVEPQSQCKEFAHLCQRLCQRTVPLSPLVFRISGLELLPAVLLAAATASAQERRIQLEDLTKIVTVSDPQISPDGKSIVCVVSRQNFDEDRSDSELVLVDVSDRRPESADLQSQGGGVSALVPERRPAGIRYGRAIRQGQERRHH